MTWGTEWGFCEAAIKIFTFILSNQPPVRFGHIFARNCKFDFDVSKDQVFAWKPRFASLKWSFSRKLFMMDKFHLSAKSKGRLLTKRDLCNLELTYQSNIFIQQYHPPLAGHHHEHWSPVRGPGAAEAPPGSRGQQRGVRWGIECAVEMCADCS